MAMTRRKEAEAGRLAPTPTESYDRVPKLAREDPRVNDRAYRVLATLECFCWGDSRETWVSNHTIAERSGRCGPETVRRALRLLERLGYLEVLPDPTKVRGQRIRLLYQFPDSRAWARPLGNEGGPPSETRGGALVSEGRTKPKNKP